MPPKSSLAPHCVERGSGFKPLKSIEGVGFQTWHVFIFLIFLFKPLFFLTRSTCGHENPELAMIG